LFFLKKKKKKKKKILFIFYIFVSLYGGGGGGGGGRVSSPAVAMLRLSWISSASSVLTVIRVHFPFSSDTPTAVGAG